MLLSIEKTESVASDRLRRSKSSLMHETIASEVNASVANSFNLFILV